MTDLLKVGNLILAHLDEAFYLFGLFVASSTATALTLRTMVIFLGKLALLTKNKADDFILNFIADGLLKFASGADSLYRMIRASGVRGFGDKVVDVDSSKEYATLIKKLSMPPPPIAAPNRGEEATVPDGSSIELPIIKKKEEP